MISREQTVELKEFFGLLARKDNFKAFQVLYNSKQPMNATEVANLIGVPSAELYRLLTVLKKYDLVYPGEKIGTTVPILVNRRKIGQLLNFYTYLTGNKPSHERT